VPEIYISRTPTKNGGVFLPRTSPSHLPENCRQYTGNSPEKYVPAKCHHGVFWEKIIIFLDRPPLCDKFPAVRYH